MCCIKYLCKVHYDYEDASLLATFHVFHEVFQEFQELCLRIGFSRNHVVGCRVCCSAQGVPLLSWQWCALAPCMIMQVKEIGLYCSLLGISVLRSCGSVRRASLQWPGTSLVLMDDWLVVVSMGAISLESSFSSLVLILSVPLAFLGPVLQVAVSLLLQWWRWSPALGRLSSPCCLSVWRLHESRSVHG